MTQYVDKSGMSAALSKINSYIKDKLDAANKGGITSATAKVSEINEVWNATASDISANQTSTNKIAVTTRVYDYYLLAMIIYDITAPSYSDPFDISHTITSVHVVKCPDTTTSGWGVGFQYGTVSGSFTKDTSNDTVSWSGNYSIKAPSQNVGFRFMIFGINVDVITT